MRVNNISSQNFGMALKIKPEALDALKKMPRNEIEQLQRAGETLKDTKFYHLEIGKNGERIVDSSYANKYKGGSFIVHAPKDEFLKFNAIWEGVESANYKKGDLYSSWIKFPDKDEAWKAYEDIKDSKFKYIEVDTKMVKYLDEAAKRRNTFEIAQAKEKKAIEKMADDLFEKYQVN